MQIQTGANERIGDETREGVDFHAEMESRLKMDL